MTHTAFSAMVDQATDKIGELRREKKSLQQQCSHLSDALAESQATHEELLEALGNLGDGVTDMFEQLTRGNWVDDHGHSVLLNAQMIALENSIPEAQAAIKSARGQT